MTEQSCAQFLADKLDADEWHDAAAELRRLDALNAELVEVLSEIMSWEENEEMVWAEKANSALNKAKEQT